MNKTTLTFIFCIILAGCSTTLHTVKEVDGYCASDKYITLSSAEYDALRPVTQQDIISHDAYWDSKCDGKSK